MLRIRSLSCLVLGFLSASGALAQAAPERRCDPALAGEAAPAERRMVLGGWRHVELSRFQDGKRISSQTFEGDNILRFECDGFWSLNGPVFRSSGKYRWVGQGELEQAIMDSTDRTQRGKASIKKIVVDAETLEFHSWLAGPAGPNRSPTLMQSPRPAEQVHVITRFRRMPG